MKNRLTLNGLTYHQKQELKQDAKVLKTIEIAKKWGISQPSVRKWAAKLGYKLEVQRLPIGQRRDKKTIQIYRGFEMILFDKVWRLKGTAMMHSQKETLMKFVDAYLKRAG